MRGRKIVDSYRDAVFGRRTISGSGCSGQRRDRAGDRSSSRKSEGRAMQQALAARLVVVSGPRMNLPAGTRVTFTLAAPIAIEGAGTAAPVRRPGVTR